MYCNTPVGMIMPGIALVTHTSVDNECGSDDNGLGGVGCQRAPVSSS